MRAFTRPVEHLGSAHTDAELALLLPTARERLAVPEDLLDPANALKRSRA